MPANCRIAIRRGGLATEAVREDRPAARATSEDTDLQKAIDTSCRSGPAVMVSAVVSFVPVRAGSGSPCLCHI